MALSRSCRGCRIKRRLVNGLCAVCDGRDAGTHQARTRETMNERAYRKKLEDGIKHTLSVPKRDREHEEHRKRFILVAGCAACSRIGQRLPAVHA